MKAIRAAARCMEQCRELICAVAGLTHLCCFSFIVMSGCSFFSEHGMLLS